MHKSNISNEAYLMNIIEVAMQQWLN